MGHKETEKLIPILAPSQKQADSGPNLMGDWNASNILQNQGRANFSQMQQPKPAATSHDPFANLTSMGQSLPKTQPMTQQQPQMAQQRPMNPGVTSSGAWGAQFQTRQPQAAQQGGWNASAYMQTNTAQYKKAQEQARAPPAQPGAKKSSAGAFDNLLDGFGGASFGQKTAQKNMKMGDLKV